MMSDETSQLVRDFSTEIFLVLSKHKRSNLSNTAVLDSYYTIIAPEYVHLYMKSMKMKQRR